MVKPSKYGRKIPAGEYEQRLVKLYQDAALRMPSHADQRIADELKLAEFHLVIEHRLGQDFPQDKRQALWAAKQRVESTGVALEDPRRRIVTHVDPTLHGSHSMLEGLRDEFEKILSSEDLRQLMGIG